MGWVENATPEVEALSQWPTILAVCLVLSFLSIVTVSMRLWIRFKARGLAADDWMASLSMVFALIYSVLCIVRKCNINAFRPGTSDSDSYRQRQNTDWDCQSPYGQLQT